MKIDFVKHSQKAATWRSALRTYFCLQYFCLIPSAVFLYASDMERQKHERQKNEKQRSSNTAKERKHGALRFPHISACNFSA